MVRTRTSQTSSSCEKTPAKSKKTKDKMAANGSEATNHDSNEGTELVNSSDLKKILTSIRAIEENLATYSIKQEEFDEEINGQKGIKEEVEIIKDSLSETVQEEASSEQISKNQGRIIDS